MPKQLNLKIRYGLDEKIVALSERLHVNPNHFGNECLQAMVDAIETPEPDIPPFVIFCRRALGKLDHSFWFRLFDKASQWLSLPGQMALYGKRVTPKEIERYRALWSELLPIYALALAPQKPSDWMRLMTLANARACDELLGKDSLEKLGVAAPKLTGEEKAALESHAEEIDSLIQKFKSRR